MHRFLALKFSAPSEYIFKNLLKGYRIFWLWRNPQSSELLNNYSVVVVRSTPSLPRGGGTPRGRSPLSLIFAKYFKTSSGSIVEGSSPGGAKVKHEMVRFNVQER